MESATAQSRKAVEQHRLEEGLCVRCGNPRLVDGTGYHCRRHADEKNTSAARRSEHWQEAGLCVNCGQPRGEDGTDIHCRPCADKKSKNALMRRERQFKEERCAWHQGPLQLLKHCPICIYQESNALASSITFEILSPPASGDELEVCVGCQTCGRIYHRGHPYSVPHIPPDLKLRDEHVGKEGHGVWLRFSREDEQGQVPIEYEECSLPNEKCEKLLRKVRALKFLNRDRVRALNFLNRHRAGKRISGACHGHRQDTAGLREAIEVRLRQQLAQNGNGQKYGNGEKRRRGGQKGEQKFDRVKFLADTERFIVEVWKEKRVMGKVSSESVAQKLQLTGTTLSGKGLVARLRMCEIKEEWPVDRERIIEKSKLNRDSTLT